MSKNQNHSSSHSAVRSALMKMEAINFSQEYIDSYYMEFSIPPRNNEVNSKQRKKNLNKFSLN
jgi:hypothetical protein